MNQPIELSVDNQGQLLVPLASQGRLRLSPGMVLVVERGEDESLRLRVQEEPELVDEGGVLVVKGEIQDDLTDFVQHERDTRLLELAHRGSL